MSSKEDWRIMTKDGVAKDPRKPVELPKKAREGLKIILSQKQLVEIQFQSYVKGCFDSLNLDGDWDLDAEKMAFNPRPPKPEAPK